MSVRLKSFSKAHLDALAHAADLADFDWTDAALWDPLVAYATGTRCHDCNGFYYKAKIPAPPVGTPPPCPTYWEQDPPDWRTKLNAVRYALQNKLYTTARGYGAEKGLRLMEACVVSGPWEIGIPGYDGGGIRLTNSLSNVGVGGSGDLWVCAPYAMKDLELWAERADCRLDIQAGFDYLFSSAVGAVDPAVFMVKLGFNVAGYVTGSVAVNVTGTATPSYSGPGVAWDPVLRLVSWTYADTLLSGVECHASIAGGSIELVACDFSVRWKGPAATVPPNVVSAADVYRAPCSPVLPHVSCTKIRGVYDSDTGMWSVEEYSPAGSANCQAMYAIPVNYLHDTAPYGRWRLRAKTLPAANVRYITEGPPELATHVYDNLNQRQGYVCHRVDDTGVSLTFNSAQSAIREIDTLFARRDIAEVDQTLPVVWRTAMATTRSAWTVQVGYLRTGDSSPRLLSSVDIPGTRFCSEHYLGRSTPIIIWDALPLVWYGADRAEVVVSATGPVASWSPNGGTEFSWTTDLGLGTTTPIGYLYCAAQLYDDLMAAVDAMKSAGAAPVDILGRVNDLGRITENPYAAV